MKKLITILLFSLAFGYAPAQQTMGGSGKTVGINDTLKVGKAIYVNGVLLTSGGGGSVDRMGGRVWYASKCGLTSSADLQSSLFPLFYGSNQQAATQRLFDSVTYYGGGTIYLDVAVSVDSIKIRSNTNLIGLNGGGLLQRMQDFTGIAPPLLMNANPVFGYQQDSNITITNVKLNSGGYNAAGTRLVSPSSNNFGISAPIAMYGVKGLNIIGCSVVNSPCYLIETIWCANANIINTYGEQTTFPGFTNRDGFHLDACQHCRYISNHLKNTGDDALTMTASDIFYRDHLGRGLAPTSSYYPEAANGDEIDVKAFDNFIDSTTGGASGFRYFCYAPYRLIDCGDYGTHGVISGGYHHIIDRFDTSYKEGYMGTITIADCHVMNQEKQGQVAEMLVTASIDNLIIRNYINEGIELTPAGQYNRGPALQIKNPQGAKVKIGALVIDGYQCKDTTSTYNTNHIYLGANATIDHFLITGSSLRRIGNPALSSSTFIYQEPGDTINNISYANCAFNKLQYMAILYGYTKYAKRTGVTITGNINNPGFGGYAVVNTGRIDVMDDNGFSVDSSGTDVYIGGSASVGNKIGSYNIQKAFVNKYTTNTLSQDLTARRVKGTFVGVRAFMGGAGTIPDTVATMGCYGTFTATLPTGPIDGQYCNVYSTGGGTVTINPGGYTIVGGQAKTFVWDVTYGGSGAWVLLAKNDANFASHQTNNTNTPTATVGAGAIGTGTGAGVTVYGDDQSGWVVIHTSTTPTAGGGILATITFNSAYTLAPRASAFPSNNAASTLPVYIPRTGNPNGTTATTFTIVAAATPPTATDVEYEYHVN